MSANRKYAIGNIVTYNKKTIYLIISEPYLIEPLSLSNKLIVDLVCLNDPWIGKEYCDNIEETYYMVMATGNEI
jgi:hypothetical protein